MGFTATASNFPSLDIAVELYSCAMVDVNVPVIHQMWLITGNDPLLSFLEIISLRSWLNKIFFFDLVPLQSGPVAPLVEVFTCDTSYSSGDESAECHFGQIGFPSGRHCGQGGDLSADGARVGKAAQGECGNRLRAFLVSESFGIKWILERNVECLPTGGLWICIHSICCKRRTRWRWTSKPPSCRLIRTRTEARPCTRPPEWKFCPEATKIHFLEK
jgi:hypothetical protein